MGDSDNEDTNFNIEEELEIGNLNKVLNLENVDVPTGEESEECIFKMRIKLFRFRNKEWKERGIGETKLLRNKKSNLIRFILRQDKTLKVVANFFVSHNDPFCKLEPHQGSDKMFLFYAYDCSEDQQVENFVVKTGNANHGKNFREHFEAARVFNKCISENNLKEAVFAKVIEEEKDEETKEVKKEEKIEEKKEEKIEENKEKKEE